MSATGTRRDSRRVASSRSAVFALCLGNAVQWYDFAPMAHLPASSGPVFFQPGPINRHVAAFATYGIALIVRLLGALLFGRMGPSRPCGARADHSDHGGSYRAVAFLLAMRSSGSLRPSR